MAQQQQNRTDWKICAICQKSKDEPLRCPADSNRSNVGICYTTVATNIEKFEAMKCLLMEIEVSRPDEGKMSERDTDLS